MSKEAKGPVSLCSNIADMCVPFQVVTNCYANVTGYRLGISYTCTALR